MTTIKESPSTFNGRLFPNHPFDEVELAAINGGDFHSNTTTAVQRRDADEISSVSTDIQPGVDEYSLERSTTPTTTSSITSLESSSTFRTTDDAVFKRLAAAEEIVRKLQRENEQLQELVQEMKRGASDTIDEERSDEDESTGMTSDEPMGFASNKKRTCCSPWRRRALLVLAACSILLFAVGVPVGILLNRRRGDPAVEMDPAIIDGRDRASQIVEFINGHTLTNRTLRNNPNSTNFSERALSWIIESDPLKLTVDKDADHLIQRFVLATFMFAQSEDSKMEIDPPSHECEDDRLNLDAPLWLCDPETNTKVTDITSSGYGLFGPLPEDVALLTHLSVLDFRSNSLNGTIPSWIGSMTNLEIIKLGENEFTGSVPSEFEQLRKLRVLDLQKNYLEGTLSTTLGQLTQLEVLRISNNTLSGAIPWELGRLSNLRTLHISRNFFTGTVPSSLGQLTNINGLWLQGNQLNGTLPSSLSALQPGDALFYENPALTGSMPFCNTPLHARTTLVADCDRVDCPCCSYCCPRSRNGIPVYRSCGSGGV